MIDSVSNNLGAVAGGAIAIGFLQVNRIAVSVCIHKQATTSCHHDFFSFLQIAGIVLACFVAIYKHRENKYEVV